jgi:two-component system response regulator (stage 0 sporulation protein A)
MPKINQVLLSVGIKANLKGYKYLTQGVQLKKNNPDMKMTKDIYPSVAKIYETTPQRVERAMRHEIETAFNSGRLKQLNAILGAEAITDCPTVGEFLALMAEAVK